MKQGSLIDGFNEPKLVLFDMDGVLFDTMPTHARSWKRAMDHFGISSKESEFFLYEGMKGTDTVKNLYYRQYNTSPSDKLVDEIYDYKCQMFDQDESFELRKIPGTYTLMEYLANDRGLDIGVVTGSTIRNAHHRIEKYYADFIPDEHIITADVVTRGKPHPEPYLRGMELFGHKPEETLVVENAPLGVRSGVAAGAYVVAVMTGPIPESLFREEGAQQVFPDMRALHLWWQFTFK
ncbi:MAG: HAD family phosphatase [Porphyromonas sp.]|nr:HAD family phosphatase [Porphyromonas sp.]